MAKKITESAGKPAKKRVSFVLEEAPGKIVCVAGSFNDWNPDKKRLEYKVDKGVYSGFIMLEPGSYEYKFVVDGEWRLDERNHSFSHNDFGTLNSMIIVE